MSELTDTHNEMIDTNVLVYAHDKDAGIKHERAKQLIHDLSDQDRLIFTVQVLNEFYAAITHSRRPNPLPHEEATQIVLDIAAAYINFTIDQSSHDSRSQCHPVTWTFFLGRAHLGGSKRT